MTFKKLFYVLVVIICAWLSYYLLEQHWRQDVQVTPNDEKPMFIGNNVSNTSFDLKGTRQYQLDADHLEHFNVSGLTTFTKPVLWVFKQGQNAEWRISANSAKLEQDKILHLQGNVRIFNLLPDSDIQVIKTNNLRLNLVNKDFDTDDHVTINGPAFQNQGDGMKGNMSRNVATLLKNVKGRYEPTKN
ncbi:LPS export ABC transporter periplasmic protein LptC [Photobacterium phosphoreum]|jgi:lipopolysaccharide export system protein LptC|uniref:Lipopolysaccharide export system protein LptC n=1 Tax=Photobacterium phosphoreum TaxID=659 RepID=A0AAW5A3W5_PHOPO|nr:LPS export ABC transporter periplasmic protein LptC [Photobacterium phosphoreum]MCD9464344.1 LPS export ABC transporter periplasmic protein LptC [Photobacterium phosphoreum]MCD9472462.1 LPS export ABC transporter periplasmic protein LptC [Photobacterium phosphoreum]MCD9475731.1 LPS export ABC transporter periplasmic protein LptC [Photobacterium phosphoreum]MCD9479906.1 LPS export ABC transporter periplasmic protein LptC [Photobacterium phosphoreum]MCD9484263.1 LPS export ABC transporter per